MTVKQQTRRAIKPDAQGFDEIRIITTPRFKESEMSGDEWRISATIQLYRKGRLIEEHIGFRNVEVAAGVLLSRIYDSLDNGNGYFAGEELLCDQEGCHEPAPNLFRLKKEFSRDHPAEWNKPLNDEIVVRRFCDRHAHRGNSNFDDSDDNYERIEE